MEEDRRGFERGVGKKRIEDERKENSYILAACSSYQDCGRCSDAGCVWCPNLNDNSCFPPNKIPDHACNPVPGCRMFLFLPLPPPPPYHNKCYCFLLPSLFFFLLVQIGGGEGEGRRGKLNIHFWLYPLSSVFTLSPPFLSPYPLYFFLITLLYLFYTTTVASGVLTMTNIYY